MSPGVDPSGASRDDTRRGGILDETAALGPLGEEFRSLTGRLERPVSWSIMPRSKPRLMRRPTRMGSAIAALLLVSACAGNPDGSASLDPGDATPGTLSQAPTGPVPIIVDTDVDVSDVAALIVLLRNPAVDVRAVTITPVGTGVTDCGSGRAVIRYVLEEMGATDIPFACGRTDAGPDALPFPPEWRSNADSGWGFVIPPRPQTDLPEAAVDLLARVVADSPSPPLLVPLGPWTNLEDVLASDATFVDRVAGIHAMASAIDVDGNVFVESVTGKDRLEWNVAADPSAFVAVFQSGIPVTLVPLDATNHVPMNPSLVDRLAEDHAAAGADFVYELFTRVPGRFDQGQQLWDELAALALTDPDIVTWEDATLRVADSGRLDRDAGGQPVRFAITADRSKVEDAFLTSLRRGGPRATPFALSGDLVASWDGAMCVAEASGLQVGGLARVTFENSSGTPAGVAIARVLAPHTWADVSEVTATIDVEAEVGIPEWIVSVVNLDSDGGVSVQSATMLAEAGTHGPVCISGEWPDVAFTVGSPFEVSGTP